MSAVALVLLGRFWERASWAEPAAIGIVVGFVLLVAVAALAVRIDQRLAARAADRGLQTKAPFTSALVLEHAPEPFGTMIRDRADHVAAGATSKDAIPVRLHRRPLVLAAVLGPLALVLGVISNPQDEARRQRAAERAAIAEVADELDARAEELAAQGERNEAAQRLQELADRLAETDSIEEATQALDEAAAELAAEVPSDRLAEQQATQGSSRAWNETHSVRTPAPTPPPNSKRPPLRSVTRARPRWPSSPTDSMPSPTPRRPAIRRPPMRVVGGGRGGPGRRPRHRHGEARRGRRRASRARPHRRPLLPPPMRQPPRRRRHPPSSASRTEAPAAERAKATVTGTATGTATGADPAAARAAEDPGTSVAARGPGRRTAGAAVRGRAPARSVPA
ncbi:MAG: hypothetical protein R2705_18655 [Ilumatobacteraceae bacterium]